MNASFSYDTYITPFTWRYGTDEMRSIWSESHKRLLLRRVWVALAKAQKKAGLVTQEQVDDLVAHQDMIDIQRVQEIESEIRHDLMAEIRTFAEQCPVGGSIIHLGATSMDALDNMEVMRQKEALSIILGKSILFAKGLIEKMHTYANVPCIAFTHIQPAEITTVGYRLAQTAQDIHEDIKTLKQLLQEIKGKGMKGAVGSSASYTVLLEHSEMSASQLEELVMSELGLTAFTASTQVYPRKQDWKIGVALAGLCQSLYKFAFDFRLLQSPAIGEWSEPFGKMQVGSSAMPFKRNPIDSEKIDSLCRWVASQCDILWHNAANSLLERTLDDSANRRVVLPEMFLATEETLMSAIRLINGMNIHEQAIQRNLGLWGVFASSERLLMELVRRGADRQLMHEVIRHHSLAAWEQVQQGKENPLIERLADDAHILSFVSEAEVHAYMDSSDYIGDAPQRTHKIIELLESVL
ncbi:MAG: adenylosuccinate lyase [Sphaerochaetaceae bacterium]|nr:adenylosuccinate lyase [Sphaerochaetaceae bacterium]